MLGLGSIHRRIRQGWFLACSENLEPARKRIVCRKILEPAGKRIVLGTAGFRLLLYHFITSSHCRYGRP